MIELPRPLYYLMFIWVVGDVLYEALRHNWSGVAGTIVAITMGWLVGRVLRNGDDDDKY